MDKLKDLKLVKWILCAVCIPTVFNDLIFLRTEYAKIISDARKNGKNHLEFISGTLRIIFILFILSFAISSNIASFFKANAFLYPGFFLLCIIYGVWQYDKKIITSVRIFAYFAMLLPPFVLYSFITKLILQLFNQQNLNVNINFFRIAVYIILFIFSILLDYIIFLRIKNSELKKEKASYVVSNKQDKDNSVMFQQIEKEILELYDNKQPELDKMSSEYQYSIRRYLAIMYKYSTELLTDYFNKINLEKNKQEIILQLVGEQEIVCASESLHFVRDTILEILEKSQASTIYFCDNCTKLTNSNNHQNVTGNPTDINEILFNHIFTANMTTKICNQHKKSICMVKNIFFHSSKNIVPDCNTLKISFSKVKDCSLCVENQKINFFILVRDRNGSDYCIVSKYKDISKNKPIILVEEQWIFGTKDSTVFKELTAIIINRKADIVKDYPLSFNFMQDQQNA